MHYGQGSLVRVFCIKAGPIPVSMSNEWSNEWSNTIKASIPKAQVPKALWDRLIKRLHSVGTSEGVKKSDTLYIDSSDFFNVEKNMVNLFVRAGIKQRKENLKIWRKWSIFWEPTGAW